MKKEKGILRPIAVTPRPETPPPPKGQKPDPATDAVKKAEKRIRSEISTALIGIEKKIAYIKGLAVGSEAGDDIIKDLEWVEAQLDKIKF